MAAVRRERRASRLGEGGENRAARLRLRALGGIARWNCRPAPVATAAPTAAAPGAGGNTLGDGTGPVSINGPTVGIHAPMVQADGVLQAGTIIADSVVASSYSPGAGNVW